MSIKSRDIKLLFGRAAGRCSFPGCASDVIKTDAQENRAPLNEMAHIIARSESGTRGDPDRTDDNSYDNLILLCPTHHALVDDDANGYTVDQLRRYKRDWEAKVAEIGAEPRSRRDLSIRITPLLLENQSAHDKWGPESPAAIRDPLDDESARIWDLRRSSVILPNNEKIAKMLRSGMSLLSTNEQRVAIQFLEHAEFYQHFVINGKCGSSYIRFPSQFTNLIEDLQNELD